MPKRKIETHTARSLKAVKPIEKEDKVQALLDDLYKLAMEKNNTTAAKIYLDVVLKRLSEEPVGLTAEDALKILREMSRT